MSSRDPTRLSNDLAQWAQHTLGIDAPPGTDKWQSQVLQQLTASDFIPPDDWYDAIDVYQGVASAEPDLVPLGYFRDREDDAKEQVRQFASHYFDLAPEDRRAKWQELAERCAPWPVLKRRLGRLEQGLDVIPKMGSMASQPTIDLGNLVCRKFLRISDADERESWLQIRQMRQQSHQWEKVAQAFRITCPHLYKLQPEFVDSFADFTKNRRRERWKELIPEGIRASIETILPFKRAVVTAFIAVGLILLALSALSSLRLSQTSREPSHQTQRRPNKSYEELMNELQKKLEQQERDKPATEPPPGF